MKLSAFIEQMQQLQASFGDVPVVIEAGHDMFFVTAEPVRCDLRKCGENKAGGLWQRADRSDDPLIETVVVVRLRLKE